MKKRVLYLIILTILVTACAQSDIATDELLATESQRSWCYGEVGKIKRVDQESYRTFNAAMNLFESDSGLRVRFRDNYSYFVTDLENDDEIALKVCKIWADMN